MTPAAVLFDLDGVLIDSRVAITNCINFGLKAVGAPTRSRAELAPWIGPPLIRAFAQLAGPEQAQDALDGVLIDSRVAITNCINFGLEAVGAPTRRRAELAPWIGPPLIHAFAQLASPEQAQDALDAYRSRYATTSLHETVPVPGAREALAAIHATSRTALATSKPRVFALPLCERLGFARHLDVIEGPSLHAITETKAQTVARALAALGLGPGADAVLVGDRRHDVEGAHANGIRCVGVLWGIGDREELEAAGADVIAPTLSELPDTL